MKAVIVIPPVLLVFLVLFSFFPGCEDPAPTFNLSPAWQAYEAGRPEQARSLAVQAAGSGVTRDEDLESLLELLVRTGEAPRAVMVYQSVGGKPGSVLRP